MRFTRRHLLFAAGSGIAVLCGGPASAAANFRLWLKDGSYQMVREYKVEGDRVSYYSVERSDTEEIPLDLVDIERTEKEAAARKENFDRQAKEIAEEESSAREERRLTSMIPQDAGVYGIENGKLVIYKLADPAIHNDRKRQVLKVLSPLPTVSDKAALEIPGAHATAVTGATPEFYIQLSRDQLFGIIRLTTAKDVRVVEHATVVPISKETIEERDSVEVFTKQLATNGLYKIWPQKPLEKGEYAVVEYTDGTVNIRVWDFRVE